MLIQHDIPEWSPTILRQPWIGKVLHLTAQPGRRHVDYKPEFEFGKFYGDSDGGYLEIAAEPGDILRIGQSRRDGSPNSGTWHVVQPDGDLKAIDYFTVIKLSKQAGRVK